MKRILYLIAVLQFCCISVATAQPVRTRTGSYTYLAPSDQTPDMARKAALDRAKLKILEDEYGTVVGVSNISRMSNVDGTSSSSFLSIGETEVQGEWISTVGTPSYEMSFQGESMVIKVTVTGKIRERKSSSVVLDVKILRNGADDRDQSDFLVNGDDFFVSLKTPVKGYVAVYQYDSDGVFRLLPYSGSQMASVPVRAGQEYVFFSKKSRDGVSLRSEMSGNVKAESHYRISCNSSEDLCRYYILFSPNEFFIANDEVKDNISQLDFSSFQRWLGKVRRQDDDMTVVVRDITLRNK